jgi:hypothetical protein
MELRLGTDFLHFEPCSLFYTEVTTVCENLFLLPRTYHYLAAPVTCRPISYYVMM